jgi:hypothetical protein
MAMTIMEIHKGINAKYKKFVLKKGEKKIDFCADDLVSGSFNQVKKLVKSGKITGSFRIVKVVLAIEIAESLFGEDVYEHEESLEDEYEVPASFKCDEELEKYYLVLSPQKGV